MGSQRVKRTNIFTNLLEQNPSFLTVYLIMISHPTTIITSRYISSSTKTFAPTFLEIWKLYLLFKLCRSFARYISRKIVTWSGNNLLWVSRVLKYPKKVFGGFDNERNWVLTMAFWATCKIAQPIQPIWQHIFALS